MSDRAISGLHKAMAAATRAGNYVPFEKLPDDLQQLLIDRVGPGKHIWIPQLDPATGKPRTRTKETAARQTYRTMVQSFAAAVAQRQVATAESAPAAEAEAARNYAGLIRELREALIKGQPVDIDDLCRRYPGYTARGVKQIITKTKAQLHEEGFPVYHP